MWYVSWFTTVDGITYHRIRYRNILHNKIFFSCTIQVSYGSLTCFNWTLYREMHVSKLEMHTGSLTSLTAFSFAKILWWKQRFLCMKNLNIWFHKFDCIQCGQLIYFGEILSVGLPCNPFLMTCIHTHIAMHWYFSCRVHIFSFQWWQ